MAIYTPPYFAGRDEPAALRLIHDHPLATLVTSLPGEEPHISYIPMLFQDGALLGHLARVNPQWQAFARGITVALFHGPHAFVSPQWYPRPDDNVPTWNYAVVHVHGQPQVHDDGRTLEHLERLFTRFGGGAALPTKPEKVQRLLGGIVPFRMPIGRIDAKFKMSQNKSPAEIAGVVAGLRAAGDPASRATAEWMERQ